MLVVSCYANSVALMRLLVLYIAMFHMISLSLKKLLMFYHCIHMLHASCCIHVKNDRMMIDDGEVNNMT